MSGFEMTRRKFHASAIYFLNAVMAAAVAVPALGYLLLPKSKRRKDAFVDAGDISHLSPGVPAELSFQLTRVDGWRVVTEKRTAWVVKGADNRITAYGPQCTHLGCAYHWEEQPKQFVCPCHASLFSISGEVVSGPAPRRLDRYEVRVAGGRLLLGALRSGENA